MKAERTVRDIHIIITFDEGHFAHSKRIQDFSRKIRFLPIFNGILLEDKIILGKGVCVQDFWECSAPRLYFS